MENNRIKKQRKNKVHFHKTFERLAQPVSVETKFSHRMKWTTAQFGELDEDEDDDDDDNTAIDKLWTTICTQYENTM